MVSITLLEADRQQLKRWSSDSGVPAYVALRSRIILRTEKGQTIEAIRRALHVAQKTVILWRSRFEREGRDALWEVPSKPGRKRSIPTPVLSEI